MNEHFSGPLRFSPNSDNLNLAKSIEQASAFQAVARFGVITSGELKAKLIGKGWRIKRSDLDEYIEKLF